MQAPANHEDQGFVEGVLSRGSGAHPHVARLCSPKRGGDALNGGDRADALALLATLHGRLPGLVDHAANVTLDAELRRFLIRAGTGFALERSALAKLTMRAGPAPSTPGDDRCTAAIETLRHSLDLLGQSERQGCAAAAALALLADWIAIRPALDIAAQMIDLEPARNQLPSVESLEAQAAELLRDERSARAARFGQNQLLMQHCSFWDMLAARCEARRQMFG